MVKLLHALNMTILAVAKSEFDSMGCNILALGNDQVILLEGKRRVVVPDFDALLTETGDDADGGVLV